MDYLTASGLHDSSHDIDGNIMAIKKRACGNYSDWIMGNIDFGRSGHCLITCFRGLGSKVIFSEEMRVIETILIYYKRIEGGVSTV